MFALQRYTATGSIDTSFGGGDGSVTTTIGELSGIRAVTIDTTAPSPTIIAAGTSVPTPAFGGDPNAVPIFTLARYSDLGTLAWVTVTPPATEAGVTTTVGSLTHVAVQANGKILAGGSVDRCADSGCNSAETALSIARYNSGGSLDTSFASGIVFTQFQEGFSTDRPATIAIQPELQKVVLAGTAHQTFELTSLVRNTNVVTATTAAPHNLNPGDTITISAASPEDFRGTVFVDSTPDANTFTYTSFAPDGTATDAGFYTTADVDFVMSRYELGITNTAPTVAPIAGPSTGVRNFSQTFSSSFSDPDSGDTWTVNWNFGDPGSGAANSITSHPSPGSISASHIYAATGSYTVTLNVDDGVNFVVTQTFNITITATSNSGGTLQIGGNGGNDTITVKQGSGSGSVIVTNNGTNTTYNGVSTIMIAGGGGNDDIKINPNVTQNAIVFGGAGNDSVKGGGGNDILVGGDGDDLLHGQAGRDLLIGGDGADRIIGHTDDDILVAGYTIYDSNVTALQAVLSEWTSSRTYSQRSNNVLGPTTNGSNGTYFLRPYDSSTNNSDATVFDDGDVDVLTGNQGQDLFLFNSDPANQDTITDLNAGEFAVDIDWITNP